MKIVAKLKDQRRKNKIQKAINSYLAKGRLPWSEGYIEYRNLQISEVLKKVEILDDLSKMDHIPKFGFKLDERIVEYLWIFSHLNSAKLKLLDAGSTLNFQFLLDHPYLVEKEKYITTFAPESENFNERSISYIYSDLRNLPFKDELFDLTISQSTIEHIDMDNSIYGYDLENSSEASGKSFEFLIAINELIRVTKKGGKILVTFPFGKYENHGFFQQFDDDMLVRIEEILTNSGNFNLTFFQYINDGWHFCERVDCRDIHAYNPHTGKGKGTDGAAHCRSICCIEFKKN